MRKAVEPPRFPALFIISALAVVADIGGLIGVFVSGLPLPVKIGIAVPLAGLPSAALLVHAGRRREWLRLSPRIRELEGEVRSLREQLPPPAEAQRAA